MRVVDLEAAEALADEAHHSGKVPAPSVCPTCEGSRRLFAGPGLSPPPCPDCCCEACGQPTETPPLCARCDVAQDAAYERRRDA